MPVIDGEFIPRSPLTLAETHVDWAAHNNHIVAQRDLLERECQAAARRLAAATVTLHGIPPLTAITALAKVIEKGLGRTAKFGYHEVVREIDALRAGETAKAGWVVPDPGRYAQLAVNGIEGIAVLIAQRALETSRAIAAAIVSAISGSDEPLVRAITTAKRSLHLHVLELIGETLNMGRSAGAMSLPTIPEFALRSEQLDKNTCEPCDHLHGTVVQVGTPQYFAILPPVGCLGGGRCRGIMVFGDGPRDVRQPAIDIAA